VIFAGPAALLASGFAPQVCIVGSGPAGITLALGLRRHGVACLIVEAGGFDYSADSQDHYRAAVIGDAHADLRDARLRQFGGTSGHWQGWCRALDAVDFEARVGIPDSGWPIRKTDLDPYTDTTQRILEIAAPAPDRALTPYLNEISFAMSPPVRFAGKYRAEIAASPSIGLLVDTPVVDIVPVRGRIEAIELRPRDGTGPSLRVPYYCLCGGGVENSRLLLWANARHREGVVPHASTLGRYWMDHPHFAAGEAIVIGSAGESPSGMRFFSPSAQVLRDHPIGNVGIRMFIGTSRIKRLLKSGLCVAPRYFDDLMNKVDQGAACGMHLLAAWEQLPHADNRIELDSMHDDLGMPRAKLFWRKRPVERESLADAMLLFGRYLAESRLGALRLPDWLAQAGDYPSDEPLFGFHHMGGTRMARTPAQGVVDADCKVFGVDNLYIGGSSVFTTAGHANPTHTIVQLSLRLADHLAARIAR
jgi:choline dehydrogenase-like flavoprotein